MQLNRLTRDGVLWAISESERLGRVDFLADNGFREAVEYFLLYDGSYYDSKAIAGVAYRADTGITVSSKDFSGGKRVVARLQELGFEVTGDADWSWPELVLACDVLHAHGWTSTIRKTSPVVRELSIFLRSLNRDMALSERYRSAGSVQAKLENLRTLRPDYPGKPTRHSKLDEVVVAAYLADPAAMHAAAEQIRGDLSLAVMSADGVEKYPGEDELGDLDGKQTVTALEGAVRRRWATQRERGPRLRERKIADALLLRGEIACEVCDFDFSRAYPGHGDGYIEVHHRVPLHVSGEVDSALDDLVLLCANCHRMIHRRREWLTPEGLREILADGSSTR